MPIEKDCETCGVTFETYPSVDKRFCSVDCFAERDEGPWNKNGDYQDCEQCGETFYASPSEDRRFCSRDCFYAWRRETGEISGERNPQWKPKVELVCEWCEEPFRVVPSQDHRIYCSIDCLSAWRASRTGREHPLYKHNSRSFYHAIRKGLPGPAWSHLRETELEERCRVCGGEERLTLHHIVPVLGGGTNERWNLLTVCGPCHGAAEKFARFVGESVL